jgi:hypothetical protein
MRIHERESDIARSTGNEAPREPHARERVKGVVKAALHIAAFKRYLDEPPTPTTALYLPPFSQRGRNDTKRENAQREDGINKWKY